MTAFLQRMVWYYSSPPSIRLPLLQLKNGLIRVVVSLERDNLTLSVKNTVVPFL